MGNQTGALQKIYAAEGPLKTAAMKNLDQDTIAALKTWLGSNGATLGGAESFLGGENYVGGFNELQDYGNSMYSAAKEKLIRNIASEVFSSLKASGMKNPQTAPIGEVVKSLTKFIPPMSRKAKKFNDSFNKSSSNQSRVCEVFGKAINKNYGGLLIDLNANQNVICDKVAEVMYSLFTGLHTEFLSVAGDVIITMKNMQTTFNILDSAYKKQKEYVEASGDPRLKEAAINTDNIYNSAKSEHERQSAIFANLMNVSIGPTGKSLISSLEDNRDFASLVRDIKAQVGTDAFGDKLAYLLSGISSVAHSAELIEKALKKIGMSVQEFKNSKTMGDLRMKVFNHVMKSEPNSKHLDSMMAAAKIIYENNYDHAAISKAMSKNGKGESYDGGYDSDGDVSGGYDVTGGDEDETLPAYWAKKSIGKKIDNKKKYRDLIFADFRKNLKAHYHVIVNAANAISRKIGVSIPISDELSYFINAFEGMRNLDEENLHIALSGYAKDSLSKEKREQFMNNYDLVMKSLEPLTKGPEGSLFKQVQAAISSTMKAVDDFSDKMVRAITEIHVDNPSNIAAELRKAAGSFYGSGESADHDDVSFGSGSWVAFDKVKAELKYFYAIANIKTNIARSSVDNKEYADGYETILGEEAGWIISRIKEEYNELIEKANPTVAVRPNPISNEAGLVYDGLRAHHEDGAHAALVDAQGALVVGGASGKRAAEWAYLNLVDLWTFQMNAKVNMINAAQAVDLYLKAFTDGIAKNPDTISSVVKMLDQVEIVARWFNDRSGDNMASLFEVFPNSTNGLAVDFSDSKDTIVNAEGKISIPMAGSHYYNYLETRWAHGATAGVGGLGAYSVATDHHHLPGNPFLGRPLFPAVTTNKQLKGILGLSEKVVKSMRALENILSCFSTVGSKFGDIDPMSKTFMNPGQMFNILCNYIAASSFTHQFAPNLNTTTAAIYAGKITQTDMKTNDGVTVQTIPTSVNIGRYRGTAGGGMDSSLNIAHDQNHAIDAALIPIVPVVPYVAGNRGILTGVSNIHNQGNPGYYKYSSMAMSAIPAENTATLNKWKYHDLGSNRHLPRVDVAGWRDNFYDTDLLFEMTIKSIVAKVFTVVDAYRLFHRPTLDRTSHYSLNPLRTILGGAEGGAVADKVKVIPEALEFYFRILLLAEWYRENYSFKSELGVAAAGRNAEGWRLAIVPSVDGIWSEFIEIVFDKADYVKEGNYAETQVQKMILAMNDIYKTYKSKFPKSTVRNIINAFILEMNRIFGFIKQAEIQKYLDQRRDFLKDQQYGPEGKEDFIDYDILNANDQFGSRPAPSAKFVNVTSKVKQNKARNMMWLQKEVEDIRKRMDAEFINVTTNDNDKAFSFMETLKNYKTELSNAKNDKEEYQVVLRMLQGANKYLNSGADRSIMIHEMVTAPLAVLYNVYKIMARYNSLLHGCSLVNLGAWSQDRPGAGGAGMGIQLARNSHVRNAYRAYLETKYNKRTFTAAHHDVYHELFSRAYAGNAADGLFVYLATNQANGNAGYHITQQGANILANAAIPTTDVDGQHILQDILSAIVDLTTNSNKMVTCSVGTNGSINVDYSALEDSCLSLLEQVKNNIKKLRLSVPTDKVAEVVDKFEDRTTVGSTRWLEENLVEILFRDRDECGLPRAHTEHLPRTLALLFNPNPAGPGKAGNVGDVNAQGASTAYYGSMDNALRGLVYYEHTPSAIVNVPAAVTVNNFTKFPFNLIEAKKQPTTEPEKTALAHATAQATAGDGLATFNGVGAGAAAADFGAFNNLTSVPLITMVLRDEINTYQLNRGPVGFGPAAVHAVAAAAADLKYNSLFFALNRVLRMYLYANTEDGNNKFYTPLVETFATSTGSYEVLQGKAFPDVLIMTNDGPSTVANFYGGSHTQPIASPATGSIVTASNAAVIRSLMNSITQINTAQKKKYAYENAAEIPEYMKERMRVNLPFFSKMFNIIADRASLIKTILSNTDIKKNIASVVGAAGGGGIMGLAHGGQTSAVGATRLNATLETELVPRTDESTEASTVYMNAQLTKIADLALALRKCSEAVYKELQDRPPYFFETSKDFLSEYKSRNGGMPLMPASSILAPLRCLEGDPENWKSTDASHFMMPVRENGSDTFKFNYATRAILARNDIELQMDHFPGAKDLYNSYVASVPKSNLITPQEYANTVKAVAKLGRFLADGAVYGRLFDRSARNLNSAANEYHARNLFESVKARDTSYGHGDLAEIVRTVVTNVSRIREIYLVAAQPVTADAVEGDGGPRSALVRASRASAYLVGLIPEAGIKGMEQMLHTEYLFAQPNTKGIVSDQYRKKNISKTFPLFVLSDSQGASGIVELTENANVRASKERLANMLGHSISDTKDTERSKLRVYNILDMNVVPLNVHAFMREVPFTNLLNYSYTFDRMVHDFVLPSYVKNLRNNAGVTSDNIVMPANGNVASTRELLVKLLVHPYADITQSVGGNLGTQYYAILASLFNGNDNMKLGRPRYLSDQLWHKVLMTSSAQLVAGQEMFNNPGNAVGNRNPTTLPSLEAGPAAYEALRAITRYGAPYINQVTSIHNTGQSNQTVTALQSVLRELVSAANNAAVGVPFTAVPLRDVMAMMEAKDGEPLPALIRGVQLYNTAVNGYLLTDPVYTANWVAITTDVVNRITAVETEAKRLATAFRAQAGALPAIIQPGSYILQRPAMEIFAIDNRLFGAGMARGAANASNAANTVAAMVIFAANADAMLINGGGGAAGAVAGVDTNHVIDLRAMLIAAAGVYAGSALALLTAAVVGVAGAARGILFNHYNALVAHMRNPAHAFVNPYFARPAVAGGAVGIDDLAIRGLLSGLSTLVPVITPVNITAEVGVAIYNILSAEPIASIAPLEHGGALVPAVGDTVLVRINAIFADAGNRPATYIVKLYWVGALEIDCIYGPSNLIRQVMKAVLIMHLLGANQGEIRAFLGRLLANGAFRALATWVDLTVITVMSTIPDGGGIQTHLDHTMNAAVLCSSGPLQLIDQFLRVYHTPSIARAAQNWLNLPSDPVATSGLKIIKDGKWQTVNTNNATHNNMAMADVIYCAELGKMRFDTKLVRNLTWMVQLQRIMRVVLIDHLSWLNTPVVRGLKIADPKITEYDNNDAFDEKDYTGENYSLL